MSRTMIDARRILIVLALAVVAQALLAPSASVPGPYLSALSSLTVGATTAAPINCPNNSCGGRKGCRSDHSFYCTLGSTGCTTGKCL